MKVIQLSEKKQKIEKSDDLADQLCEDYGIGKKGETGKNMESGYCRNFRKIFFQDRATFVNYEMFRKSINSANEEKN